MVDEIGNKWIHSIKQKIYMSGAFILVQALDGIVILFMVIILMLLDNIVSFFGSSGGFGLDYLIKYSHPIYIAIYLLIGLANILNLYRFRGKKINFMGELFYTFQVIMDLAKDLVIITATMSIIVILLRVVAYANVSTEYWIDVLLQIALTLYVLVFIIIGLVEIIEIVDKKWLARYDSSKK